MQWSPLQDIENGLWRTSPHWALVRGVARSALPIFAREPLPTMARNDQEPTVRRSPGRGLLRAVPRSWMSSLRRLFMPQKAGAAKLVEAPARATPWSGSPYEAAMERMRIAVLDVETTHGDPTEGRVMEVAVLVYDDRMERLRWDSLVRPRRPVSGFVKRLTGLNDAMLADAPTFTEVVRTLGTLTEDRIVVAHNVRFDMTALEHEFARTGLVFDRPILCTERLARQLIPGLSHYNLGSLCRHFGIPYHAAHRAASDAEATANLFFAMVQAYGRDRVLEGITRWHRALRA